MLERSEKHDNPYFLLRRAARLLRSVNLAGLTENQKSTFRLLQLETKRRLEADNIQELADASVRMATLV